MSPLQAPKAKTVPRKSPHSGKVVAIQKPDFTPDMKPPGHFLRIGNLPDM